MMKNDRNRNSMLMTGLRDSLPGLQQMITNYDNIVDNFVAEFHSSLQSGAVIQRWIPTSEMIKIRDEIIDFTYFLIKPT